ncbi:MAG: phosphoesterase [Gammaproteobacteria bacterium]|nr:phosphoesterase [Gammaproteobacteria bacterium]
MMKYYELLALEHMTFILPDFMDEDILNMIEYLISNPATRDWGAITYIAQQTGRYFAALQGLLALMVFYHVWGRNAQLRYNKKYTMLDLAKQEQNNWKTIMPVVGLNLIEQDVLVGPWAMAMTPLQFVKKHELIKIETVADRKSPWKTEGVKKMILDKEKSYTVFLSQMGPLWSGEFDLPEHRRALFAVFLARIEHDQKGSQELINALAVSYTKGRPDFSLVKPLIQKHRQSKKAAECVQNHAYVYTVLASMLKMARLDGVLASADFLWLKPVDRELWYVLNTVGRQTPFAEVAGPFAHWKAEEEMGRPLFRPIIEEAVTALENALEKVVYTE